MSAQSKFRDQLGRSLTRLHHQTLYSYRLEASNAFPSDFNKKVDLRKVSLQVIKPWIENKVQELLGFEDDVVTEYVMGQLESDEMQPVSATAESMPLQAHPTHQ